MNYDESEIKKIRNGINQYRHASAANGKLPSWQDVCDRISTCEGIDQQPPLIGTEMLRRFDLAHLIPEEKVLTKLRNFLIHNQILT